MSKTFCSYPWRHLYVQTTGHQKLCCLSNEHITKNDGYHQFNLSRDSLLESWNSDYIKNVRKKIYLQKKIKFKDTYSGKNTKKKKLKYKK